MLEEGTAVLSDASLSPADLQLSELVETGRRNGAALDFTVSFFSGER